MPRSRLYHANLGNALKALGRLDQATACYRRAIVLRPRYPEAYNNLGATLHAQKQTDEAAVWLRKAIALKPDFPEAHNNLGNLLFDLGRRDEAVACFRRAIALRPDYAEAHNNLGAALKEFGEWDEAVLCYRKALSLQPDFPEAHNNLGIVLRRLGRLDEAVACCRDAIALKPDLLEAYDALGAALADQGKLDEAVACYQTALALRPDEPRIHDNLGTVRKEQGLAGGGDRLLSDGHRPAAGFCECASQSGHGAAGAGRDGGGMAGIRMALADGRAWRRPAAISRQPQWRGEAAEGRTLLIHAEQGLGDTLQFCRYGALAAARGLRVVMEVQRPLVRLLRGVAGRGSGGGARRGFARVRFLLRDAEHAVGGRDHRRDHSERAVLSSRRRGAGRDVGRASCGDGRAWASGWPGLGG